MAGRPAGTPDPIGQTQKKNPVQPVGPVPQATPLQPLPQVALPPVAPTPNGGGTANANGGIAGVAGVAGAVNGSGSGGFYSPELDALKHSVLTKNYAAQPEYMKKLEGQMDALATPLSMPVGSTALEKADIYNQGRSTIQGSTNAAAEAMREAMGGRGFTAGDSGIADRRLAGIYQEGQGQLGKLASDIAVNDINTRFSQGMDLNRLNLDRLMGQTKYADLLQSGDLARGELGLKAGAFGSGLEQFMKEFGLNKERVANENAAAMGNLSLGNRRLGLDEEQFQYGQEADAINMLMKQMGFGQQNQEAAYTPYWNTVARGAGG